MEIRQYGGRTTIYKIRKLSDIEPFWNGFKVLWPKIKEACGSKQAYPKSLSFTENPSAPYANDYDLCRRLLVDLNTNEILGDVHVSTGENAIMNHLSGADREIGPINKPNVAVLNCVWSDYYRTFSIEAQMPVGALNKLLKETTSHGQ